MLKEPSRSTGRNWAAPNRARDNDLIENRCGLPVEQQTFASSLFRHSDVALIAKGMLKAIFHSGLVGTLRLSRNHSAAVSPPPASLQPLVDEQLSDQWCAHQKLHTDHSVAAITVSFLSVIPPW